MKKICRLTVRLSHEERDDLRALADATGLPPSELMRRGVLALLAYADKHGGHVILPLDFDKNWKLKSK